MKAVFLCNDKNNPGRIYSEEVRKELTVLTGLTDEVFSYEDVKAFPTRFSDTEYIFSTWGMPVFTSDEIKKIFDEI